MDNINYHNNQFTTMSTGYFNILKLSMICLLFALSGCDEQRRMIIPFVPEGDRVILLEEFTGKGCTNCPKGSREIDNLLAQFPNNLVVVSLHAGFFANPQFFPLGQYDLRTDEGEFIFDYLGPNLGYPAGVVNRIPVSGDMQLGLNQWASAIAREIQIEPAVELVLGKTYNAQTRELQVTVSGIGKQNVSGDIRLSLMLTESGIVDAQDDFEAGGIVPDYVHNHVLRDMLTPAAGAPVLTSLSTGQSFTRNFSITLAPEWVPANMEIIGFISVVNGNEFPVLQAASTHVLE